MAAATTPPGTRRATYGPSAATTRGPRTGRAPRSPSAPPAAFPHAFRFAQECPRGGAGRPRVSRITVHEGLDDGAVEQHRDLPRLERRSRLPMPGEEGPEPEFDRLLVRRGSAPHRMIRIGGE